MQLGMTEIKRKKMKIQKMLMELVFEEKKKMN